MENTPLNFGEDVAFLKKHTDAIVLRRGDAAVAVAPAPGEPPLGPFYELETSSPGAELAPGASLTHKQVTVHFAGQPGQLDPLAKAKLGVGIREICDDFAGDK